MPPRKERKLQIREAMIIETAARLIDRVGYTHLTMDMLCDEVGIAKATLYQHFKSKEDIMIASTLRALDNLDEFMLTHSGAAVERLRNIMRYMMTSAYNPDGFPAMVMHDEVLHLFNNHAQIGAKFQHLNALLFELVDQAKADGEIAPDLPNEVIITMMMNAIQVSKAHLIYPAQGRETSIAFTLRIFFNGLKH